MAPSCSESKAEHIVLFLQESQTTTTDVFKGLWIVGKLLGRQRRSSLFRETKTVYVTLFGSRDRQLKVASNMKRTAEEEGIICQAFAYT